VHYIACDLGAESGRVILGTVAADRISLEEIHRFPNTPRRIGTSIQWNIGQLWSETQSGLRKVAQRCSQIAGISTASWGLDYVLLNAAGETIPPAYHYRDPRTCLGVEMVRSKIPWETIFAETGIQFMPMNTLYQLAAEEPGRLQQASQFLLIADAFNFWLSGIGRAEESLASTTQLYNPRTKDWSSLLLAALDIPRRILPGVVPSGMVLGPLRSSLNSDIRDANVIASCSHDTGAAVAGVPADGTTWAYLSSGTWSLLGVELSKPVMTDRARELNFTNEIGFGGTVRLLKNIVGLWIVQECKRSWTQNGQTCSYSSLTDAAAASAPFTSLINPADPRFLSPDDVPEKIADYCRQSGQSPPARPGATIRCVLESLALLYRKTLLEAEQLSGRGIDRLHIVGGGSQNALLNQFTANAIRRPVLAGPSEATALGNIIVQGIALGDLPSLEAGRELIRHSVEISTFAPRDENVWAEAYKRFLDLH
jgi:rhamnulokinase